MGVDTDPLGTCPREDEVLSQALHQALRGGVPGMVAQAAGVSSLMWLHTALNYQYKHGVTLPQSMRTLWADGGLARFYRGFPYALALAPAARFMDTASNAGCLWLLDNHRSTEDLPLPVKTAAGSALSGMGRLALMPLDVLKTVAQVEGGNAWTLLSAKLRTGGVPVLFHGGVASATANVVSHYPWFLVYNTLDSSLPEFPTYTANIVRNGAIGFSAATAAAVFSNGARVIKTAKQTHESSSISYTEILLDNVRKNGLLSFFGRGLQTRILINGLQSMVFTVLWKIGQELYSPKPPSATPTVADKPSHAHATGHIARSTLPSPASCTHSSKHNYWGDFWGTHRSGSLSVAWPPTPGVHVNGLGRDAAGPQWSWNNGQPLWQWFSSSNKSGAQRASALESSKGSQCPVWLPPVGW